MAQNANSLKDILPTLKRITAKREEFTYSHGKTYRENGFILKHQITSLKIKSLVTTFVRKLKRNITSSTPVDFRLENPSEEDNSRWLQLKGWDIQDHFQGFIIFLDVLMALVTLILSTFQAFLDDFKNGDEVSATVISLKVAALVVFISRILMSMVTLDYVDDTLYLYVTDIICKEIKGGSTLIRLFSLIMVIVSLFMPSNQTVGTVFFFSSLLMVALIRENLKILEIIFINSMKKFYIWNLIRVVIFNIIFAHIVATALLATSKINGENNWILVKLVNNNLLQTTQTWYVLYLWSYYWACTIMLTIGFGDISPVDYREAIIVAFIEIFSSIVLAYNISEVGSIVSKMRNNSQILERKLGVLRRTMKKNPIPDELQWKIESYISHEIQIKDIFEYQEHRGIIEELPEQLRQQYFLASNQQIYQNIPVFCHFQRQTLAKINRAIQGRVYYSGEYIIKHKDQFEKLIIICSGTFGLTFWKPQSEMNGVIIQSINIEQRKSKGMLITNNILERGSVLNYDIVALQYSYGMQLNLQAFLDLLKQNKLDYYFYRSVLDKHQKEITNYSYIKCEYCKGEYHSKFQCTKLHYIPIKSEKILKYRNNQGFMADRDLTYTRMVQRTIKHAYYFRKNLFSILQQSLNTSFESEREVNLQIDIGFNFSMYFKPQNPENLISTPISPQRSSHKAYLLQLKGQIALSISQFE